MNKIALVAALLASSASAASAFAWDSYDSSGNGYNSYQDQFGNTKMYGVNSQTGSVWNGTYRPNGNSSGSDSNGNFWSSSTLYRKGGKTCVGTGLNRSCY